MCTLNGWYNGMTGLSAMAEMTAGECWLRLSYHSSMAMQFSHDADQHSCQELLRLQAALKHRHRWPPIQ